MNLLRTSSKMLSRAVSLRYSLRCIKIDAIKFSSAATKKTDQLAVKENETQSGIKPLKLSRSKELFKYLESLKDSYDIESLASPYLLKIHQVVPESLYLVSSSTAKSIVNLIGDKLKGDIPVVEVNPGIGCLTKELLNYGITDICLFESSPFHQTSLTSLCNEHKNLKLTMGDFFGLWKLDFQDKMDGGNRIEAFFNAVNKNNVHNDVAMKVVGAMPSLNFIKYLTQSIVFQKGFIEVGRPELFIAMPPSSYYGLVPLDSSEQSAVYRYIPVLFNLFCNIELIAKVPRRDFLPWQTYKSLSKSSKKENLKQYDQKHLFIVHIKIKSALPCKTEHLPLLWYFFKHHLLSKSNRVIPMLEQWIPGCGVWLITGQDPPGSNADTLPDENDAPLPRLTIFTQFSDLSPAEKVTIFKKFISWPEFKHCPFQEAMDNHISKNLAHSVDMKDEILDQEE